MKTASFVTILLGIVVTVSLLSVWFYPSTQDLMTGNSTWNGLHDFQQRSSGRMLASFEEIGPSEGNTLLSVPYIEYGPEDLETTRRFVEDGGTLVLMDDFGYGNQVLEYLGLSARFDRTLLADPLFNYRNPNFPLITDLSPRLTAAGINVLVFNKGTVLTGVPPERALARSSDMSFLDADRDGVRDTESETGGPFVVAAEFPVGNGMVRLVADPSIVINSMVGRSDNHEFVRYLASRDGTASNIIIDNEHLTKTNLDLAKLRLAALRQTLSAPHVALGIAAAAFALTAALVYRRPRAAPFSRA